MSFYYTNGNIISQITSILKSKSVFESIYLMCNKSIFIKTVLIFGLFVIIFCKLKYIELIFFPYDVILK
ncbi:MAG TPA: hypothetical protein DD733_00490 [Clostridiales bacterium]|nr:hypothetical protein [Clostridiales bacterium]